MRLEGGGWGDLGPGTRGGLGAAQVTPPVSVVPGERRPSGGLREPAGRDLPRQAFPLGTRACLHAGRVPERTHLHTPAGPAASAPSGP